MTFPSPPFPPWVRIAARAAELVCDLMLIASAGIASRGAPVSVSAGFGHLEWVWPLLLAVGGLMSATGTFTAWLQLKLAGIALSAGGLLSWAAALAVAAGRTSGQESLLLILLAASGLLIYRVVVQLAMTHLSAGRSGVSH